MALIEKEHKNISRAMGQEIGFTKTKKGAQFMDDMVNDEELKDSQFESIVDS